MNACHTVINILITSADVQGHFSTFIFISPNESSKSGDRNAGSIPVARSLRSGSALFVCGSLFAFTEPRGVFAHHVTSFYKCACSSDLWIEYTNICRERRQKSKQFVPSIVFECPLAHGFCGKLRLGARCL